MNTTRAMKANPIQLAVLVGSTYQLEDVKSVATIENEDFVLTDNLSMAKNFHSTFQMFIPLGVLGDGSHASTRQEGDSEWVSFFIIIFT